MRRGVVTGLAALAILAAGMAVMGGHSTIRMAAVQGAGVDVRAGHHVLIAMIGQGSGKDGKQRSGHRAHLADAGCAALARSGLA